MNNDNPKSTTDTLARKDFAARVAQVIRNLRPDDEGFTIAIEARWGEGKTWLLEQIRQNLINHCVAVQFNPWLVGARDKLLEELFGEISAEIGKPQSQLTALIPFLSKFINAVSRVSFAVAPKASFFARCIASLITLIKSTSLQTAKYELANKLRLSTRKIVVFIDDIDRLHPTEAVEIIRLLKAVGELPNVVYVIAIDPDYLVKAIEAAQYPNATTYLDKIIQLRLSVPPLRHTQKEKLLTAEIDSRLSSDYFKIAPGGYESFELRWQAIGEAICGSCENIRDIKRVWNRFDFIAVGCAGEINPIDLLALQVVYIKAPNLYRRIELSPKWFLTGSPPDQIIGVVQAYSRSPDTDNLMEFQRVQASNKAMLHECVQTGTPSLENALLALITGLFPNFLYPELKAELKKTGLLSNESNLIVALNAGVVSEQWRTTDINLFLTNENRDEIVRRCESKNLLDELLGETLVRKTEVGTCNDPLDLLVRLCDLSIQMNDFDSHYKTTSGSVIRAWLEQFATQDIHAASKLLSELTSKLTETPGRLFFLATALEGEFKALGAGANASPSPMGFDPRVLRSIRARFGEKVIFFLDSGSLLEQPRATKFFWMLANYEPELFESIATSFDRFEQWALLNSKSPSITGRFSNILYVPALHVILFGGIDNLSDHIAALASKYVNDTTMSLWLTALQNPDTKYDMATGQIRTDF